MAFELKQVVPWGRNLEEYKLMFNLSNSELDMRIISFGDGPASFNAEMTKLGKSVISIDPIYTFTKAELQQRILVTKDIVIEQTTNNVENFVWKNIKDIHQLEEIRINAMNNFLEDFEIGKSKGRYIYHELPNKLQFADSSFDIGLSSHFLILYSQLGVDFHIKSISEMLRLCNEVRLFPLLNLNIQKSEVLDGIIRFFESDYELTIAKVDYEFQKNANEMLVIQHK